MKITIVVEGLRREYEADEDTLMNNDWNEVVEDMIDSIKESKEEDHANYRMPMFAGTEEALDNLKI
jgi:hypothetical protein